MTVPQTLHFPATADKIAAVRAKLGIPAGQTSGSYNTPQAELHWHLGDGGVDVDVMALHGVAKFASEAVVRSHIADAVGLA